MSRPEQKPARIRLAFTAGLSVMAATALMWSAAPAAAQVGITQDSVDPADTSNGTPAIEFEQTRHDFGDVYDDKKVTHVFKFTNTGDGELVISNVKGSCGCTVPEMAKTNYAPGESGEITVAFNPARRSGVQNQRVTVNTNVPGRRVHQLSIRSVVKPLVYLDPAVLQFGAIEKGGDASMSFTVTGRKEGFQIEELDFTRTEAFDAELGEAETVFIEGTEMVRYPVTVSLNENAQVGRLNDVLEIRTNDERKQAVYLNVVSMVQGDLMLNPPRLSLGIVAPGERFTQQVRVVHRKREPFNIVSARIREGGVNKVPPEVTIEPLSEWSYRITINGIAPEGRRFLRGNLIIESDVPGETMTEVLYYGNIRGG
ncbi:MAG: DUF1573 domain-containing protein [Planctomycetota bacterium]